MNAPRLDNPVQTFAWLKEMTAKLAFGPKFNGQFVALKDGEYVTDQVSGTTYCTRAAWNALRAEIDQAAAPATAPTQTPPSPATPAAKTGDLT